MTQSTTPVTNTLSTDKISPDALWLNVSPSFQRLDQRLLGRLAGHSSVAHWAYSQTPDEPCSLEVGLTLLHDYIKARDRPLHLIGHSTSGLLGLLYTRKFPQQVASLTLLSVGVSPAVDWKAHYYNQLGLLHCSRTRILAQMVYVLFGHQPRHMLKRWLDVLEQDLVQSLSLHSLVKTVSLFPAGATVPLLICGGGEDAIVTPNQIQGWQPWLKPGDRIWLCPQGRHFFHNAYAQEVADEIFKFWQMTAEEAAVTRCSNATTVVP